MDTGPLGMPSGHTDPSSARPAKAADNGKATTSEDDEEQKLIDRVREVGFRALVEEIHEKKMEELRAKILETMGLSEEELAALPAEQRQAIEDMIARKIKQYMATDSATNGGSGPMGALTMDDPFVKPGATANGSAATDDMAAGNGLGTGLVILQALEAADLNTADSGAPRKSDG